LAGAPASAAILYSNLPGQLSPDNLSLSYQAWLTSELGNLISPDLSSGFALDRASIALTNFAPFSAFSGYSQDGYTLNVTLTLYYVGPDSTVGGVISSQTTNALIQWQPENEACSAASGPSGFNGYIGSDQACHWGLPQLANFTFPNVSLPSQLIYGVAFNTSGSGYNPIGSAGPYDALNYFLVTDLPTVGTNPLGVDFAYWNTTISSANGGTDGVFALNSGWTGLGQGAIQLEGGGVPEPAVFGLAGAGLIAIAALARRKAKRP